MQGHLYHGNLNYRRRSQGTTNTHEELDFYHFLRGRRHLRRHHVDRLFVETVACCWRQLVQWKQLLHWLRAVLVGTVGGSL